MVMGKARSGKAEAARCRRHRQGAGVCASCLRERLSHLSLSASLPSVVRGEGEVEEEYEVASSCSEVSTAYSSEGSSVCSSAGSECASPAAPGFHDEMRRAARVSLLMRHERVVGDADAVAAFLRARREQRSRTATSFWAKLLHATRGGGKKQEEGCSLAHSKTLQERGAAAKWVLF